MFLSSLIGQLCTKEENDKTGCNFNFGHECRSKYDPGFLFVISNNKSTLPLTVI